MIAYVDCLPKESKGKCWNRTYYEDEDELLPLFSRKPSGLQPKTEGSLRRRLLTSKIHQQQDALWTPRPLAGPWAKNSLLLPSGHQNSSFIHLCQDHKAVSSLDDESKWTVHYTAPWHQQENVFLPGSRPDCVEDLHRQAKVNLKRVLRECDKLEKDGSHSSQYYHQDPGFSHSSLSDSSLLHHQDNEKKSSVSSPEEELLVYSMRPRTPVIEESCDSNGYTSWTKSLPLPTPEEKMRQQAQSVVSNIIPINVTGENFDRQASFRRSLINTDTVIRRTKKVRRRKTITGVPDNIQRELASKAESRAHSMCITGQFSTLGRTGSINSTLHFSETRDSGCQTEEIKIVPSMRRIRAQRGQGIAAQMAQISTSSSGSLSAVSDCNGFAFTPQLSRIDQDFHSLPRTSARVSAQPESKYGSLSYRMNNGSSTPLRHQVGFSTGTNSILSPNFRVIQSEEQIASSSASRSLSDSLHSTSDFDSVPSENGAPSLQSVPPYPASKQPSSKGSSRMQSSASLREVHTETGSQCSTPSGLICSSPTYARRESSFSESSTQSCNTLTSEQWGYDNNCCSDKPQIISSCSSPVNHAYGSLEHSPTKTDSSSLYSVDNEGYYTSMRLDSGLKSHSHNCISKSANASHGTYGCDHESHGDRSSLGSNMSLSRNFSLRKAKKPPLPPQRTDSLRRKPVRKSHLSESVLNERLITSLQQSLQMNTRSQRASFSPQSPSSDFEDPWVLRPRSHSAIGVASSQVSDPAAMCSVVPSNSDSSSQHSDCNESWDFCTDYQGQRSEKGLSCVTRSASEGGVSGVMIGGTVQKGTRMCLPLDKANPMKDPTSPEKIHRLTSPSSGYSSQSNTPTTGTPFPLFIRAKSPGVAKPKPKVPERKSSLVSSKSVSSSSSTSISSNTSDTTRNPQLPPAPPLPGSASPLSPHVISESAQTFTTSIHGFTSSPPLTLPSSSPEKEQTFPLSLAFVDSQEITDTLSSPEFPSPPPEREIILDCILPDTFQPQPNLPSLLPPPPLPVMNLLSEPVTQVCPRSVDRLAVEILTDPCAGQQEEAVNSPHPLITTGLLEMVRLHSLESKDEGVPVEEQQQDYDLQISRNPETFKDPEICQSFMMMPPLSCLIENAMQEPPSVMEASHSNDPVTIECGELEDMCEESPNNVCPDIISQQPEPESMSSVPPIDVQTCPVDLIPRTLIMPLSPDPPVPSRKPRLSLIIPPLPAIPNFEVEYPQVLNMNGSVILSPEGGLGLFEAVNGQCFTMPPDEDDSDSGSSTPMAQRRHSLSSELSSDSFQGLRLQDLTIQEHDLGLSDDRSTSDGDDEADSTTSGSTSSKEEEFGVVLESLTEDSLLTASRDVEVQDEMVTPARPRTTEDLFAVIHRSKRKILGRGDCDEERGQNLLFPSSPVTPTGSCPALSPGSRAAGSIQRSLRRSTTSSDSFKALLLRKGTRSESSFRMSAAERLRNTDPRLQRSQSDSSPSPLPSPQEDEGSSSISPLAHGCRAAEEWPVPRLSPALCPAAGRHGRSRTPPSAASSRYNTCSRIPSSPMTAICEKEGELTETLDCGSDSEPLERLHRPVTLDMNCSTPLCIESST
ncbi:NHS-like protein 1 isoform X3 [Denticeps clupeoides]|uniref:NHS-like protein 1 n=1 Tax=Denticeps clupeoides TaxID=299321 RepID=A0AAY4DP15_9TELE|nr:NHS-like protein 1 isoform X3 [Denticeps clupeoides]